ncbi:MAG: LytTR family DNA-binding domain-containing protein [Bacteroidales bacterium]|nr:LytTR family DNA-binding domain-containing protein [Bacteroidales bacterium]
METLRCIIVDDEPLALGLLETYVRKTPFLRLEGAFSDGVSALERLKQGDIDLAFLDIQMPDLNGLELARLLPERTAVVFVTAYEQYAVEGFKVDATDYLLKPAAYADFLTACERAAKRRKGTVTGTNGTDKTASADETLFVKADYTTIPVKLRDIRYIEGVKDYVLIHLDPAGGSRHPGSRTPYDIMSLQSMKSLAEFLPAPPFIRIHRSYIVNLNHIDCIERQRVIFGDVYLPVSDSYREAFEQAVAARTP